MLFRSASVAGPSPTSTSVPNRSNETATPVGWEETHFNSAGRRTDRELQGERATRRPQKKYLRWRPPPAGRTGRLARGSRGGHARMASGRPRLSPAGRGSYDRSYRCTGISPTGSTKSGNDHNRPYHGPAGLLANPLGSSYVVRTTDRAGVMLDVELRLAVQTDVGERFRGRQPCRAFGPIQDTHRDHTHR